MTLRICENIIESFGFAKDGLVGYWLRWIILIVITCIPIVNFITYGYVVKIYKGGDIAPELEKYGEMFINGIKLVIIELVYNIIPIIMIFAGIFLTETETVVETADIAGTIVTVGMTVVPVSEPTGIVLALILIGTLLAIIFSLVAQVAGIRFAKTETFGEGFNFEAIFETLKEIGWSHYILSFIVFVIVAVIIVVILSLIPFIGWLLLLIITPLLTIWQGKFFENLYSRA